MKEEKRIKGIETCWALYTSTSIMLIVTLLLNVIKITMGDPTQPITLIIGCVLLAIHIGAGLIGVILRYKKTKKTETTEEVKNENGQ